VLNSLTLLHGHVERHREEKLKLIIHLNTEKDSGNCLRKPKGNGNALRNKQFALQQQQKNEPQDQRQHEEDSG